MNVYKELEEIEESQDKLSRMMDTILDLYKKNPKACSSILKECQEIREEYSELHEKFTELQKQL